MAKLILPNGKVIDVWPKNKKTFTLDELQKHVGGYIELVRVPVEVRGGKKVEHHEFIMYVDEDGISKNLPINMTATRMYHSTHGGGRILGPALVGTKREMGG